MGKRGEKEDQLPRMRREVANIFMRSAHYHQTSWRSGRFPNDWKKTSVTLTFKMSRKDDPGTDSSVSQPLSLGRL